MKVPTVGKRSEPSCGEEAPLASMDAVKTPELMLSLLLFVLLFKSPQGNIVLPRNSGREPQLAASSRLLTQFLLDACKPLSDLIFPSYHYLFFFLEASQQKIG